MDREYLRLLMTLIRPHGWVMPFLVLLNLIASVAECVGVGLLIPLLTSMQSTPSSTIGAGFAVLMKHANSWFGGEKGIVVVGILIVGLVAIKAGLLILQTAVATRIVARVTCELRVQLCRKLLYMNYQTYVNMSEGHVMNVLDVQTAHASDALMEAVSVIGSLCFLLVFGASLVLLSWQMSLLVTVAATPALLLVRLMSQRANGRGERLVALGAALSGRVLELLSAMRTIRVLGQERAEELRFIRSAHDVREAFAEAEFRRWSVRPMSELIYLPVFLVVVGYGWWVGVGVPGLVVFLILLYRMQPHASRIDFARVSLANSQAGVREVAALLKDRSDSTQEVGVKTFDRLATDIVFDRVCFSYSRSDAPVIDEVTFRIRRGAIAAIVGKSGAGKSTLVNLLMRLYDPSSGTVLIDGVPSVDYDVRSIRQRFAFAGQDTDLLIGTIRDNIAFGAPAASTEAVRAAAQLARADDFIRELPDGYETQVGPRGIALSGGQRQRIALARALVRNPDVLILDEATSSVDPETDLAIQRAIERLREKCTIIIIAHRLGTIRAADIVLVMDGGRLVAQGTPASMFVPGGMLSVMTEL